MKTFRKYVPFTKVAEEPEGVRVWAVATKEELDRQGEVVSYDASKAAFQEFADWFEKTTKAAGQDPSKGTVRVMHQPIVAGKMLDWKADDENRQIPVSLLITDETQGRKVKNGEYTGISIGGDDVESEPKDWKGKDVPWVTHYRLGELSLVDTPACNSAVFLMVKRADPAPDPAPVPTPEPRRAPGIDPFADFKKRKTPSEIAREQEAWDKHLKAQAEKKSEAAVAPAPKPLEPVVEVIPPAIPPVPLSAVAKADEPQRAVAHLRFAKAKFTREQAVAWARTHGFRAGRVEEPEDGANFHIPQRPPEEFESLDPVSVIDGIDVLAGPLKASTQRSSLKALLPGIRKYSESASVYPLLCALHDLQNFTDAESFEAMQGADASQQANDIAAAGGIFQDLIDLLSEEFAQQVRSYVEPGGPAREVGMALVARVAGLEKALSPLQIQKLAEEPDLKENMTAMHEIGHALTKATMAMGAACKDGLCKAEGDAEAGDEGTDQGDGAASNGDEGKAGAGDASGNPPPKKDEDQAAGKAVMLPAPLAAVDTGGFTKVLDAIAQVGAQVKVQGEQVGAVKAAVAALPGRIDSIDARLLKIEKAPAPVGRPAPRAAEKSLGAGAETLAAVDEAGVLQRLAANEKDPHRKTMLVMMAAERTVPPYSPQ